MQDTQWMKIDEAAKCIGISAGTLRNWVWQHKIPHFKIGGLVRFRCSELEAWVKDALVPVAAKNGKFATTELNNDFGIKQ
jgi:excisionase family DNA binding protein